MGKRFAVVLLVLALVGAAGCAGGDAQDDTRSDSSNTPSAEETAPITLGNLPTEPGYAWDVAQYGGLEPLPVELRVAGPWTLLAGADWPVATTAIVSPADVPNVEQFGEYDFVVRSQDFGAETYYPRAIRDGWMLQLGRVDTSSGAPEAQPYEQPLRLWPVTFAIGDEFVVLEGQNFRVDATVLAQNTVVVPAGEIPGAYLLRFVYTPITAGAIEGTSYYILAPDVGFVASFSAVAGDEAGGFTAIDSAQVLVTLPEKR